MAVADAETAVVEIIVAETAVVEMAADAAATIAADGITGDGEVPVDGTGTPGKHSAMDSVRVTMPGSGMDSGKAVTTIADLEPRAARDGQGMDAIQDVDAADSFISDIPYDQLVINYMFRGRIE